MAQPLENRITAALRASSRLKDVETTIADVENEIGSTKGLFDKETARSVDPELTTPQAREARNNAADLEHDMRRLNASLELLRKRRQSILDDEAYAKRLARYEAARKEQEDLAQFIRTRYHAIAMELVAMMQRIQASDAENAIVNRDLPRGAAHLKGAEGMARGHYNYSWSGGTPVTQLNQIVMPMLGRVGCYLPIPDRMSIDYKARLTHFPKLLEEEKTFCQTPIEGLSPVKGESAHV